MFTICSLYVHYMFTICSLYVHYMFTILFTILLTVCSLYVHYIFNYMFTIYSLYAHYTSIYNNLTINSHIHHSIYRYCSLIYFTIFSPYIHYVPLYIHYMLLIYVTPKNCTMWSFIQMMTYFYIGKEKTT